MFFEKAKTSYSQILAQEMDSSNILSGFDIKKEHHFLERYSKFWRSKRVFPTSITISYFLLCNSSYKEKGLGRYHFSINFSGR
jgi:hypothetical protein